MARKKGPREIVRLESTSGSGHFRTTTVNNRNLQEKKGVGKLEPIMMYDPKVRKHVLYKQVKINKSKKK
jgi:large subunit ribosomal protein L33